ncbi:MAG: flagellar basal-body MS-ring/collar protein FliF [FCB group bacterium]|jgi:flagellar M-ring protein FliF
MAKNEIINQTKTFVNKLPFFQKVIIIFVTLVVIVGLVYLFSLATDKEYAVLYTSLDEKEASKIVEKLKEKEIAYKFKDNGTTILVDKTKLYDTRLDMANQGLPESGTVGYELFDKTNLGMSEFVQKLNLRRALEGELAKTIGTIDDVLKARVHIVIPEKALFDKDQKLPTASVTLHMKSTRPLNKSSIVGIQNLVASSVEGMSPNNVTIVDQRGKILSEVQLDESTVAGMTAKQYLQQMNVEHYLTNKVQSLLDGVLGEGNSEVRVNADLDFTQIEKTITDYDPEKQVVRSEQQMNEQSSSVDSLNYPAVNSAKTQTNTISNYEITKSVQKIVEGVGTIKRLSVATLINGTTKVIDKNGNKTLQYTPRSDEDMQKLTLVVKNAIGFDPSRNDQVSVLTVPFDTSVQEESLKVEKKTPWMEDPDNIKLLILLGVIFITVIIMYRLLQSKAIKERLRIALALPDHISVRMEDEEDEVKEEHLHDLVMDDDQMLLLPAELPDQMMLEGDRGGGRYGYYDEEEEGGQKLDKETLAARARARLEGGEFGGFTEESLLKIELKNKVQEYIESQPGDAVKLIRMLLSQDVEEKPPR